MSDFRQLKTRWKGLIVQDRWRDVLQEAMALPGREAIGPLISFLPQTPEIKWRGVAIFGKVLAQLANHDLENARVVMRQLMWQLNEESGNLGWGIPEAFGSALACTARYATVEQEEPDDADAASCDQDNPEQCPVTHMETSWNLYLEQGEEPAEGQAVPPEPRPVSRSVSRTSRLAPRLTQSLGTRLTPRLAPQLAPRLASRVAPRMSPRVASRLATRLDQRSAPRLAAQSAPRLAKEYSRILHSYIRNTGREDNFCEHGPMRKGAFWAVGRFAAAYPDLAAGMFDSMLAGLADEEAACRGMAAWGLKIFNTHINLSREQKQAARDALQRLASSEDQAEQTSLDLLDEGPTGMGGTGWNNIREATVRELARESLTAFTG